MVSREYDQREEFSRNLNNRRRVTFLVRRGSHAWVPERRRLDMRQMAIEKHRVMCDGSDLT